MTPTANSQAQPQIPTLLTVQQFCERHRAFTPGGLRWFLFNREENGLHTAVMRVGKKLLIDERKFFEWVKEQNN